VANKHFGRVYGMVGVAYECDGNLYDAQWRQVFRDGSVGDVNKELAKQVERPKPQDIPKPKIQDEDDFMDGYGASGPLPPSGMTMDDFRVGSHIGSDEEIRERLEIKAGRDVGFLRNDDIKLELTRRKISYSPDTRRPDLVALLKDAVS